MTTLLVFLTAAAVLVTSSSSSSSSVLISTAADDNKIPSTRNQDMVVAIEEMQRANYFAYVMLINMAPADLFTGNVTFLMPNDRTLSRNIMPQNSVADFLLRHSIPSPLLFEHLQHLPTGSVLPTSKPDLVLRITNGGRRSFFLNNVRIISPNICTRGSSIRCHGIDGLIQDSVLQTRTPPPAPPADCHNNNNNNNTTAPLPAAGAPSSPPVTNTDNSTGNSTTTPPTTSTTTGSAAAGNRPKKSASVGMCYFGVSEYMTACLAMLMVKLCV